MSAPGRDAIAPEPDRPGTGAFLFAPAMDGAPAAGRR
jgi:hypothetical protein